MNITLKQREIEIALRNYIQSIGISAKVDKIEFTAGRSPAGVTAEIGIGEVGFEEETAPETPEPTKTTPAKAKPFGKAKEGKKTEPVKEKTTEPEQEEAAPEKGDAGEETTQPDVDGPLETNDEQEEAEASAKTETPSKGKSLFGG